MKSIAITVTCVVIFSIVMFVRSGAPSFGSAIRVLPFCGGSAPTSYTLGSIIMVLILIWGIRRLYRNSND